MGDFRKLLVWQRANALATRIDRLLPRIKRRKPRLADQLERAAESIPSCIAEGRGRATDKDFAHFLTMAIASDTEVEHHLQRAQDCGLLSGEEHESLTADAIEVRKMLIGLRKRLTGDTRS